MFKFITASEDTEWDEAKISELDLGDDIGMRLRDYPSATARALLVAAVPLHASEPPDARTNRAVLLLYDVSQLFSSLMDHQNFDVVNWWLRPFVITSVNSENRGFH